MLYDQADRYRSVCIQTHYENKKFLREFLKENTALVTAVLARNTDAAIRISQALWNDTVKIISAALKEQKRVKN
jgi:DNA-binding GntR family transcriptional regulator